MIDKYTVEIAKKTAAGQLEIGINSISAQKFVDEWSEKNGIVLEEVKPRSSVNQLITELHQFGIRTLSDLEKIIPDTFAKIFKEQKAVSNILGVVRDWMMIHDPQKFVEDVEIDWELAGAEEEEFDDLLPYFLGKEDMRYLFKEINGEDYPG